jgi:transcriptional regulator with XRE-family HTH domain
MDDERLYLKLGEAVANRRKQLGLKQADLAQRIGLSRASVANIELGRQKVLLHHIYKLAVALGLARLEELLPPIEATTGQQHLQFFISHSDLTPKQRAQISSLVHLAKANKDARGKT